MSKVNFILSAICGIIIGTGLALLFLSKSNLTLSDIGILLFCIGTCIALLITKRRNKMSTNSGNRNSGDFNSGYFNSGDFNSGNFNSGNRNSGDFNSGNRNSGDFNSGNRNSGNFNSGNFNSGMFCTDEPGLRLFNKQTDLKYKDIDMPDFYGFSLSIWVESIDMTEDEKCSNPSHEIVGGYLRNFTYKEAWAIFWKNTSEKNRKKFLNLPNFDPHIFKEITGIDVGNTQDLSGKEVSVTIDGQTYRAIIQ